MIQNNNMKEGMNTAITMVSIFVTLVCTIVSIVRKDMAIAMLFAIVCIVFLIWCTYRHLRHSGRLLYKREIANIINTVDSVRQSHISAGFDESWQKKYFQLCVCLKRYVVFWEHNFVYRGLNRALRKQSVNGWDEGVKSLKNTLSNLPFLLAVKDLEDEVNE